MRKITSAFVFGLAVLAAVSQAEAGSNAFDPSFDGCNTLNCSSERISGTVVSFGNNVDGFALLPWTLRIFSPPNFCVRAEIVAQAVDLEMVLVRSDGIAFRDDNGGVGARPLIKANSTGSFGYGTLQVSKVNGAAPGGNFTLLYGVYPLNNVNCAALTQPRSIFDRSSKTGNNESLDDFDSFDSEMAPSKQ